MLWLKDKLRLEQIDKIISTEITDPNNVKVLYDIFMKNIVHSPCEAENHLYPCMKDRKCTKKLARNLLKETLHNENGYPMYHRGETEDAGWTASVKLRNGNQVSVDNSGVASYLLVPLKFSTPI